MQPTGQVGRQAQAEAAALAVDDDGVRAVAPGVGGLLRAAQGVGAARRPPVGDEDDEGALVPVTDPLELEHPGHLGQALGERGPPAVPQLREPGGGRVDRGGRGQDELRAGTAEGDEADPVAPLVGVEEEGEDRRLHLLHPAPGRHRPRGVDGEEDEVRLPAAGGRVPQVVGVDVGTVGVVASAGRRGGGDRPPGGTGAEGGQEVDRRPGGLTTGGVDADDPPARGHRRAASAARAGADAPDLEAARAVRLASRGDPDGGGAPAVGRGRAGIVLGPGIALGALRRAVPRGLLRRRRVVGGVRTARVVAGGGLGRGGLVLRPAVPPVTALGSVAAVVRVLRLVRLVVEEGVEEVLVDAGGVEGGAAAPVRQGQERGDADVLPGQVVPPGPRGVGAGRAGGDDVRAHPVDVEARAHPGDPREGAVVEPHVGEGGAGLRDPLGERALGLGVARGEAGGVSVVGEPASHDLGALARVPARCDVHGEPEAVEQLRAQLPSSGFMVPTRVMRAGCAIETPSRSTVLRPIAAASRSTSTRWSCRRFTSST